MLHIQISHVTHTNESCHTCECVTWLSLHTWLNELCHTYACVTCHTNEGVMSHVWMSHVTRTNISRDDRYHCIRQWTSHVTRINESCRTYGWVTSQVRMSHFTHMNESCHTHEWDMSHTWMCHVTSLPFRTWQNESCHTYESAALHKRMRRVTHTNASCHTYKRRRYHSTHEWYHTCEWVISHIWMSRVTHTYIPYRICEQVTWRSSQKLRVAIHEQVRMRGTMHAYVWHDTYICVTWLIHLYANKSHIRMGHATYIHESCHTYEWVMSRIGKSHVPNVWAWHDTAYEWHDALINDMMALWMTTASREVCERCARKVCKKGGQESHAREVCKRAMYMSRDIMSLICQEVSGDSELASQWYRYGHVSDTGIGWLPLPGSLKL